MAYIIRIKRWLFRHFQDNFLNYFILALIFGIGIILGAVTIKILNVEQKASIIRFLNTFFKAMADEKLDNILILKQSILDNFKTIGLIWLTGLIIIGIVVIPIIILFRGFALGFTVGFIVNEYGTKGFLFSILGILPQNLFIIPGILSLAALGWSFALSTIKQRSRRFKYNRTGLNILDYSLLVVFFSTSILAGILIEAFISPVFLASLFNYLK